MQYHLVAHARAARRPLSDPDTCWALWTRLQRAFPDVTAACLMPDHLHLLLDAISREAARIALARQLGAFSRALGIGPTWQPVPDPEPVLGDDKLARVVRYLHLNPDRAGLVDDPMSWSWSTHRDAIGASVDPWVAPAQMASHLGYDRDGFEARFHDYVSSDPSVRVAGTPMPALASGPVTLDEIAHAVACAVRPPLRRRLFVLLAFALGHGDADAIAARLGVTRHSVLRLSREPAPELLRVGLLFTGDPRLRATPRFRRFRAGPANPRLCLDRELAAG